MHFQIDRHTNTLRDRSIPDREVAWFEWRLVAATGTLARSPEPFESIALARGSIAQFKRSSSGMRYAKVQEPQDA